MILLFLTTALAHEVNVFEFCMIERQRWSERYQRFDTELVNTFYSLQSVQMIVFEHSFEIDRDVHPIIETTTKNGMTCWREHKNSELCYNKKDGEILWEWNTRAGETLRDVMGICRINGE